MDLILEVGRRHANGIRELDHPTGFLHVAAQRLFADDPFEVINPCCGDLFHSRYSGKVGGEDGDHVDMREHLGDRLEHSGFAKTSNPGAGCQAVRR